MSESGIYIRAVFVFSFITIFQHLHLRKVFGENYTDDLSSIFYRDGFSINNMLPVIAAVLVIIIQYWKRAEKLKH